jgi:septal ring factor EnvC (AmiA/AmiB activator)
MDPSRLSIVRRDANLTHSAASSQDIAVETQQAGEETAEEVSNTQVILASHDQHLVDIDTTFASIDARFTNIETTLASHRELLAQIDRNIRDGPARFEAIRREQRNQRALVEGIIRLIVFFARALCA